MSGRAAIVGIGATPVKRRQEKVEQELLADAYSLAMEDAKASPKDIEGFFTMQPRDEAYSEQGNFAYYFSQNYLRLNLKNMTSIGISGTSAGRALKYACREIERGSIGLAVVCGVNTETHVETADHQLYWVRKVFDRDYESIFGPNVIALDGSFIAQRCLYEKQITEEDIAEVAVRNRRHAQLNPLAQYREPITVQDVLDSRMICDPLHLLECPPRSEGAVALVLVNEENARKFNDAPVFLDGFGEYNMPYTTVPYDVTKFPAAAKAARVAYTEAKIEPDDIDLIELYEPFSCNDFIYLEEFGVFPKGQAVKAIREGQTDIDGDLPVCTDGGNTSRGHPPVVTGLYNIYEAVLQLRGEAGKRQVKNADICLCNSEHASPPSAACVEILSRK